MPLRIAASSRDAARRLAVILPFLVLGCQPAEQISTYTAPKDPIDFDLIADDPDAGGPQVRILGAIVPASTKPDDWYFFKLQMASPKAVGRHIAEFEAFIKSLKFTDNGPPTWTVPAGWREVGTLGKDRLATFRMKKSETTIDMPVTRFGGTLIDNINRWRADQAGADPIKEAEIDTRCQVLTVDGRKVVVVDVSGPGGKGPKMPVGK